MKNKDLRIKLRKLEISDAQFIVDHAKDERIIQYTYVIKPPCGLKEAKKFIKRTLKDIDKKTAYEFGIELKENKELIGTINLFDINYKNKHAEFGIWLAKKYHGMGLALDALNLILDFGFNKLKLERVQARILHKNESAQKLVEKAGFKLEGRLRKKTFFKNQWFDDLIYGILREEFKSK